MSDLSFKIRTKSGISDFINCNQLDNLAIFNIKAQISNDLAEYILDINKSGGYVLVTLYHDRNTFSYQIMEIEDEKLAKKISSELSLR